MPRERKPPSKPNMGYLVSFGDTMTALLAFFIVLNSLAHEQTGANMYSGTSSFSAAFKNLASPGPMQSDRSEQVVNRTAPSPLFCVDDPGAKNKSTEGDIGPDHEDSSERIVDRQQDNFKRFLGELDYRFSLEREQPVSSQVVFDSFQTARGPTIELDENSIRLAAQSIPMLRSQEYSLEVIVWANNPGPFAMQEAFGRAESVRAQIMKLFNISNTQKHQIRFSAKPWLFADAQRPTLSFVLAKKSVAPK